MNDDKELVEVWKTEFIKWFNEKYLVNISFDFDSVQAPRIGGRSQGRSVSLCANVAWQSFLTAKRSQPSVVLKHVDPANYFCTVLDIEDTISALTAAGIKYTIWE